MKSKLILWGSLLVISVATHARSTESAPFIETLKSYSEMFMPSAAAAEPYAPAYNYTWSLNVNLPAGYHYNTNGNTNVEGTAYIYTHDPGGKITDPIIIPEGFDALNKRDWNDLYDYLNKENMVECLANLGYDFIILNYKEGGTYIEHNAYLMKHLIELVNQNKTQANKNIVVGPSMGGLVSRYALSYMESNNMNHDTRLFVAFDTPNNGANISLGIQHFMKFFTQNTMKEELDKQFYNNLRSKAARQMLMYHIDASQSSAPYPSADPLRQEFLNHLDAIGNYPKALRKIAIANGSGTGKKQFKNDSFTPLGEGENILSFHKDIILVNYGATIKSLPSFSGTSFQLSKCWKDIRPATETETFSVKNVTPYDNAPGGYRNVAGEIVAGSDGDASTTASNQCFIPTISALGINTSNLYYICRENTSALAISPFDAIYSPVQNQEHVLITHENKNWLLNEIMPYQRLNIYSSFLSGKGPVDLEGYMEIRLLPGTILSGSIGARAYIGSNIPRCNVASRVAGNSEEGGIFVQTHIENSHNSETTAIFDPIQVYPNPGYGNITITGVEDGINLIQVFNLSGAQLYTSTGTGDSEMQMDFTRFEPGFYLLKITTSKEIILRKIQIIP